MDNDMSDKFIEFEDLSPKELRAFNKIVDNIHKKRGIDFREYRPKCLRRRIIVGMHDVELDNFCDFADFLDRNPQQYDKLLDRITINVSEFFRNPEAFKAIRQKVIPEIINKKDGGVIRNIRIWSAGCATGEEPYTLAILFKEALEELKLDIKLTIIATDIDKEAVKKAKTGCYSIRALKELSKHQRNRYFEEGEDNRYFIKPEIKDMVIFKEHNMISDNPPQAIDLILCRNVIIYFSRELQEKVYLNFHKALAPLGFLVAGKTETLMNIKEEFFTKVDTGERILRKSARRSIME